MKKADPDGAKMTPMMVQYNEIRRTLPPQTLLLFRLGDFYELFHGDARVASELLGLTLTHRQGAPMAGIPYHAAANYLKKLLAAGWKVGVCDQMEAAVPGRIVRRALSRIYTPGTMIEDEQIEASENHYLLAFTVDGQGIHGAWLEVSTGQLRVATSPQIGELLAFLSALNPREILVEEGAMDRWAEDGDSWLASFQLLSTRRLITELPPSHFDGPSGSKLLRETLGVGTLDGFSVSPSHPSLGAVGALLHYASQNLGGRPGTIYGFREMNFSQSMLLDPATLDNLEIFQSVRGTRNGSLLGAIDRTCTAAGGRLLREFLAQPLLSLDEIHRRQTLVGEFINNFEITMELRDLLKSVRDLLRMLGRLRHRMRLPRELGGILATLEVLPGIGEKLGQMTGEESQKMVRTMGDFADLRKLLRDALAEDLPMDTSEGGFIRSGFDAKLDHYRELLASSSQWIGAFEAEEQRATGIRSLRIRNTGTFGYFIEVTKANLRLVPAHYIRRQTTVNGERYTTEELRAKELEILEAQRHALAWEQGLFEGVVQRVLEQEGALASAAQGLAEMDIWVGWAILAVGEHYVRPTVDDSPSISIEGGRHPVVEQMLRNPKLGNGGDPFFVPNDCSLAGDGTQILLITGPNMGGKSTYVRQVALIVLLAQIGCWVPATTARIGCVDRIFSRIGAGDDLSRGQSTFMVEMSETAAILRNATSSSLVVLDEIGRGTSTYDGLSIAWAVVEYLHGPGPAGPRTLFTTHFHEMTQLENSLPRLKNFSVAVRESGENILFLKKIIPGPADRSYGVHVARLAGIPRAVTDRAEAILGELEKGRNRMQIRLKSDGLQG
jgi:DNA mismatch repair protein MutS